MRRLTAIAAAYALIHPAAALGDVFGSGENQFEIEFVTIGSPGNAADDVVSTATSAPLPSGSVDYNYRMAKYEISEEIIAKANALSSAGHNPLSLEVDVERGPQKPATGLSWFDAARFVNWLNEEQGAPPAYKFDANGDFQLWSPGDPGFDPNNFYRNSRAHYFMPSADEWHKAAYYDPENDRYWLYPYGSDDPPTPVASGTEPGTAVYNQAGPADVQLAGGESPFGIVGLAGNVADWEETSTDLTNDNSTSNRGSNGGSWIHTINAVAFSSAFRNSAFVHANQPRIGIRIVSVPEPNALVIAMGSFLVSLMARERKRSR